MNMRARRIQQMATGVALAAALGSASCGDTSLGKSPAILVIDDLKGAQGNNPGSFGGNLQSDVLTKGSIYEDLGEVAITITTEWSGRYQVEGDPQWREVTGAATTTATGPVFEVQERRSHLVSGLCTDKPKTADC